jgi:hypothetical protein
MSTDPGTTNTTAAPSAATHTLGPDNGTLSVKTERTGAAAKAGHNLLIHVTAWEATLALGDEPSLSLKADPKSLRVIEGTGGLQKLGDDDKENIQTTIDDEVLKGKGIEFRSTSAEDDGSGKLTVQGELTLNDKTSPMTFDLQIGDDGKLTGTAVVKQTSHKMKPYSAMFGALKVVDEVTVEIDGTLPSS